MIRNVLITANIIIFLTAPSFGKIQGLYTTGIDDHHIVVPFKVTKDGDFISHYLPHFYEYEEQPRRKRDKSDKYVHYSVPIHGEMHHLELEPSDSFIAPTMFIEHRNNGSVSGVNTITPSSTRCYYKGKIKGRPQSNVALSTCNGLAGFIRTPTHTFLIEPVDEATDSMPKDEKHRHIVYRSSDHHSEKSNGTNCGTQESNEPAHKGLGEFSRISRESQCATDPTPRPSMTPLFLELTLVLDYSLTLDLITARDVELYVYTIINMVSANFEDDSLGHSIHVKLIRLLRLNYLYPELDSGRFGPQKLLENFCDFQMSFNAISDLQPYHHDYAILLTSFTPCQGSIFGLTYQAGMCRPDKSCAVVHSDGLLLANIITHQLGHSLGADHDDSSAYRCAPSEIGGLTYHMGPVISRRSSEWSICSRGSINHFLRLHISACLSDFPSGIDLGRPIILPGQVYTANQQCGMEMGFETVVCLAGDYCKELFCQINDKECASTGDEPAMGTECGSDMWCFKGECMHYGTRVGARNGEWSEWSSWSRCSKTCSGGVQSAVRTCDSPPPAHGGRYCAGSWIKSRMCNVEKCGGSRPGFAQVQCSMTNHMKFRGERHSWSYYPCEISHRFCVLVCINEVGLVAVRSQISMDGTYCRSGTRDVCVRGECVHVGCDWVIGSKSKEDICGICHGNGTSCTPVSGSFSEKNAKGVIEFLKLPAGTSLIYVRESVTSPCFFTIYNALNSTSYLNDISSSLPITGPFKINEIEGLYQSKADLERLLIKESLPVPIVISMACKEKIDIRNVIYQYSLPTSDPFYRAKYSWEFIHWDPCPFICGGGLQISRAVCLERRAGEVEDSYCELNKRPEDITRVCNPIQCAAQWWVGPWQNCECAHFEGYTSRVVLCVRKKDERNTFLTVVDPSECPVSQKPRAEKPCDPVKEMKKLVEKRDIHDMIPFTEEDDDFHVYSDEGDIRFYGKVVNARKMFDVNGRPWTKKSKRGVSNTTVTPQDQNNDPRFNHDSKHGKSVPLGTSMVDKKTKETTAKPSGSSTIPEAGSASSTSSSGSSSKAPSLCAADYDRSLIKSTCQPESAGWFKEPSDEGPVIDLGNSSMLKFNIIPIAATERIDFQPDKEFIQIDDIGKYPIGINSNDMCLVGSAVNRAKQIARLHATPLPSPIIEKKR